MHRTASTSCSQRAPSCGFDICHQWQLVRLPSTRGEVRARVSTSPAPALHVSATSRPCRASLRTRGRRRDVRVMAVAELEKPVAGKQVRMGRHTSDTASTTPQPHQRASAAISTCILRRTRPEGTHSRQREPLKQSAQNRWSSACVSTSLVPRSLRRFSSVSACRFVWPLDRSSR